MPTAVWACGVLLAVGCQRADRAVSPMPTRAELPTIGELEPALAVVVGVEGAPDVPRVILVPAYEEIELTAAEREALGEREPPQPDALAFYRPLRGPEHGVSAESVEMMTGISGIGGALVGRGFVHPRFGSHGLAGRYSYAHSLSRTPAGVGLPRSRVAEVGRSWTMSVGEGLSRTRARRAARTER